MGKWKRIEKYPDYIVSDFGEIQSIRPRTYLKKYIGKKGYYFVYIPVKDKFHYVYIHICVAEAFVTNFYFKRCVNHKDKNKLNNNSSNLEWVTHEENTFHWRHFR